MMYMYHNRKLSYLDLKPEIPFVAVYAPRVKAKNIFR